MLRSRDIIAAIGVLWLVSTAWNEQSIANSISASIHLAFYIPTTNHHDISVFDVDGDDVPEALATWVRPNMAVSSFSLQILDLRPMSLHKYSGPFQPKVVLASDPFHSTQPNDEPLRMITGQVLTIKAQQHKASVSSSTSSLHENIPDRKSQYYCGINWHDASDRCAVACPSGFSKDCPSGENCYADTPCRNESSDPSKGSQNSAYGWMNSFHTTPAGGWPSMFTVWKNSITMHSLTAENNETEPSKREKNSRDKPQSTLQVKQMWIVTPILPQDIEHQHLSFEDVALTFIDALSAPTAMGNNAGMLLLTGTAVVNVDRPKVLDKNGVEIPVTDDDDYDDEISTTFTLALDALTGDTLWKEYSDDQLAQVLGETGSVDVPLPVIAGRTSSVARRRSLIPGLHTLHQNSRTSSVNCLHEYRSSLLTSAALPYQYWTSDDIHVTALRFDHQAHSKRNRNSYNNNNNNNGNTQHVQPQSQSSRQTARWLLPWLSRSKKQKTKQHLLYGRPNVAVTQNERGIEVRSLKNGRSLCHLSLQDETLYADINHDGRLDNLQVVTNRVSGNLANDDDEAIAKRQWIEGLASRVAMENKKDNESKNKMKTKDKFQRGDGMISEISTTPLCHLLALSGLPTKEEIFSTNLCHLTSDNNNVGAGMTIRRTRVLAAPLLAVEPSSRGGRHAQNHHGNDIVAAVSTGFVSRIRGNTGRLLWKVDGMHEYGSDFPTWNDSTVVALDRVNSVKLIPSMRPILLAGENSATLLSPVTGKVLGSIVTFPQPSMIRPRLVDLDGDGTLDLLVTTVDAVWGYHIVVTTGASTMFRIVVGILIMGLMLAFLRNRFGPSPGKRSTDL